MHSLVRLSVLLLPLLRKEEKNPPLLGLPSVFELLLRVDEKKPNSVNLDREVVAC